MEVGTSRGFNATAYDQNGKAIDGADFTWSLAANLGTLSPVSGNHTSFAATRSGTETIRVNASYRGVMKNDTGTVYIVTFVPMGISLSRSADGLYWVMTVSFTPSGKTYTGTTLAIFRPDASINLSATPLASLSLTAHGCDLQKISTGATTVHVGDRIRCRTDWYVSGSQYQISDGIRILASGSFR
jgi:hypothetical protein